MDLKVERSAEGILKFHGDMLRSTVPSVWANKAQWLHDGGIKQVDVSQVDMVDSSGLALLIEIFKELHVHNRSLKVEGANTQLRQLAQLSGVESLLSLS
ncbi:hypothetical protein CWI84_07350 [Idiomarina tyrosinivorans]|uniref:STAS domain-containing protein n=1 Tax=Idiomarina tyrosinivorans TaxID=1445662 RepID=A0A432ZQJ6_9GAMM|nr:STAS domain-containing protein [Idiomarina tyrosinivorans]RUO80108.1 hypothetical protein CWI84_07350 [Idiomarina tyrosinivorans]